MKIQFTCTFSKICTSCEITPRFKLKMNNFSSHFKKMVAMIRVSFQGPGHSHSVATDVHNLDQWMKLHFVSEQEFSFECLPVLLCQIMF